MSNGANVNISDLSITIADLMSEYTTEIEKGLEKAKTDTANEGVKELRATSPKKTGDYGRGWSKKKVDSAVVVHNKTEYRLTHLLEKGHVNRDGSRSKKFVHIAPVEEKMITSFEKRIEKVIEDANG